MHRYNTVDLQFCSSELLVHLIHVKSHNFVFLFDRNNGFLRYYTWKQSPNFLLAFPVSLISICGIMTYILRDFWGFFTLAYRTKSSPCAHKGLYFSESLYVYIVWWAVMTVFCLTTMNVQVIIRFITCMMPFHWFMAHLMVTMLAVESMRTGRKYKQQFSWFAKLAWSYCIIYGTCGIVLFANFYPPA